jgi:hypothetical protein
MILSYCAYPKDRCMFEEYRHTQKGALPYKEDGAIFKDTGAYFISRSSRRIEYK